MGSTVSAFDCGFVRHIEGEDLQASGYQTGLQAGEGTGAGAAEQRRVIELIRQHETDRSNLEKKLDDNRAQAIEKRTQLRQLQQNGVALNDYRVRRLLSSATLLRVESEKLHKDLAEVESLLIAAHNGLEQSKSVEQTTKRLDLVTSVNRLASVTLAAIDGSDVAESITNAAQSIHLSNQTISANQRSVSSSIGALGLIASGGDLTSSSAPFGATSASDAANVLGWLDSQGGDDLPPRSLSNGTVFDQAPPDSAASTTPIFPALAAASSGAPTPVNMHRRSAAAQQQSISVSQNRFATLF